MWSTVRPAERAAALMALAIALSLALGGCCCPRPIPGAESGGGGPASPPPSLPLPEPVAETLGDTTTRMEMRNVHFHMGRGVVLRVRDLRGHMLSAHPARPPVLDDPESYVISIDSAEVALGAESLGQLMNRHVFAYAGAPLRELSFETTGSELVLAGILHKVVDIPFSMTSSVQVTPAGLIRIHPTSMRICGIDGAGLMRALGIELEDLLDVRRARGVRVAGNDLLLDPETILPPPKIRGRLTGIRVASDGLVQTFRDPLAELEPLVPPDTSARNYIFFRGSTLRFGKLYMVQTDLQIVDADQSDPFEFSVAQYNRQLVAGYSETLADMGLRTVMPDLDDMASAGQVDRPVPQ